MGGILVVDDERDIRELIGDILKDEGYEARLASDADECLGAIDREPPDLVILDIWLKGSRLDGIEILKAIKRDNPDIPVVIISGHGNVELAVAAIRQGAYDFIEKPFNIDQLLVVIGRAMEAGRLRRENAALRRQQKKVARLLGESPAMKTLRQQIERLARTNSRVMFLGPAGVGKEVAARELHARSPRAERPFVVFNASMNEGAEEALFGREEDGRVIPGQIEAAHGGTLFIDEVTEIPLDLQARLVRMLTSGTFQRVGGSGQVRVDVRVLSASARDPMEAIAAGHLREDLYHRLAVVPLEVPPLEARREDIPLLARHFIEELAREQGLPRRPLSDGAAAALQAMDWPGNVRQLRNVIERILILGPEEGEIAAGEIPREESFGEGSVLHIPPAVMALGMREARELFERTFLQAQIRRFGGNISRTAQAVGMERSALHRKMKQLGITADRDGGNGSSMAPGEAGHAHEADGREGSEKA